MRINHKYDIYGRTEPSIIYLAKPGKRLYCALGGIDTSTASLSLKTNNTAELTFTVDKYINNTVTDGYEELDELMELYCDGIWFKIVDPPTINNDGLRETKEITAESYEIMLTQYKLKNFKINMGEEDSYEMMYQATHDTNKFYQIKFYDSENEDLSFLHLVLKHADVPGWHIGYVDNITPDDDGKLLPNNICNFEVDDQNVYAFLTQEAAQAYKCVFEFDTVNMTINVYRPDSLGKDTNVVLGFRNIQNSITISRDENLVTQFYVEGLDDYNIDAVNFGDSVITDLSYFICEPYMDTSLQEKYNAWQSYREFRREEFINLSKEYNKNLEVLTELMNRVPIDTAQTNWFGKKVEDLKDAYNANMAIIKGLEALYVDDEKNFDLEALKKSHDWPLYESIMNYTLPSIVAALQAQDETVEGFGKGNIISCVNPIVLGQDWYMVNPGTSSFQTIQIDDAPAYGITRGVKVTGTNGGIYQHNISIEPSQRYTLSCFVKGSGTFYLGYNNTGEDRKNVAYNITSSWTRVYTSFNLSSRLIDVAFAGTNDFTICGMQLEMGDSPSQFGYFTQSENIIKAYETDWKLYGISELKVKISTYDSCIKELKKSGYADGYNPLSGYEEAYFTQMHQKYLDYLNLKDQAETALKERQAEYDAAKKPEIQEKRNQIAKDVLLENFGKVQNKYSAFTDKETYIIKSLYSQSTYTNENIIVTTLDSTADAVDKSKVLYDDALEELYVESHPQYTYTDDVENVYALPEFKEYHEQLAVNDFVRVGITDTNYIKLRVIEITYNPCDLDESMEVTFSNMIQYKAKRNDYNTLLNDALNTSNRNGGRVNSVNKSSTSDYVITSEAIKQIFSNPLFNSMLGGTVTGGTGSGGTITADTIIAELVKAKEGVFDKLTVDTAFMKYLDVKLISADKITTRILEAEQANIEKLSAKIIESNQINADMINVKNLLAGHAGVGELHTIHLTVENAEIDQAVITNLIAKKIAVGDLMAQNALANQIVLISKDNKPTIAFQESTQQFYDSKGNVRVQIGMDGKGDFNFIVKNGDRAALFDENGITQTGIPDNTILGDMINNATITKDKLGFQIIEPNEQGGIDITNIYDGKGNQWWGIEKTTITDDYTKQIKNVTDTLTGQIETKVSNTQYLKDQESIRTDFSDIKQNVSGITSTVSSMQTDLSEAQEKIKANTSSITQNADKISFMVTGDKESEFTVTDKFIQMISDHISIDASTIDINGIITAMNTHTGPGKTKIDGGIIDTNTITADSIKVDAIRSKIFEDDLTSNYSLKGIWFDLSENGAIKGKNFAVDSNGNAYIRGNSTVEGTIIANKGYIGGIGGFTIEAGKLYSGMDSLPEQPTSVSKDKNVYIGTDGIALGSGNFRVDSNGKLYANSGTFSGTIYADGGTIGGWNISANSLSNRDGSISLNPDGLKLGNQLNIDNQGNATFGGKLSAATGSFSGELVAATGSFSGELKAARGSFKGELSGATGSFTGSVIATSITAKQSYSIYYNDVGTGEPTDSVQVITAFDWGTNTTQIGFGLIDSSLDSSKMHGMLLIKEQGARVLTLIADDINTNGWLNVNKLNITDSLGQYKGVPYKSIMWKPTDTFDFNGYNHHHTILPYKNGNFAVGMESTTTGMLSISLLPYLLSTETDAYGNITVSKTKDTTSQISIGATANPYACIYVDAIYLTGDKKTYTSLANLGEGGTTNYNGLTNKPKINNVELASGNNTLSNLGIAARSHSHSKLNNSSPVDYKGFGHCHTVIMNSNHNMWVAINNDGTPALTPYKLKTSTSYTDVDTYSLEKGGTCNLGSTDAPWNAVYAKNYYDEYGNKISTGGGSISLKIDGTTRSSGFTNYNLATQDWVTGKGYLTQHQSLYGYATTSWVEGAFGSKIDVSNGYLYLYNNNGYQLSSVQLPTSSGGNSTPSEAVAKDGTTRPIVTSGTAGGNTYTAWIGTYHESSNYVLKVNGRWGSSSSWETHGFKSNYSDIRLKTNISNSNRKALDIINSIKIRQFDWIRSGEHQDIGFIADELETLDQHFTFGGGYEEDGSMNIKSVDSLYLQGYEVKAIQELSQENQKLKNTILSLQGEIAIIKQKLEELA
ncbi:tail fiber domain-containing protein [Blautia wexlerae]|uniref:tail fiber domain-containing protein n=1 Tax=Blautia wexlerae TaxID=418240 RepID=UPI001D060B90|nr:tail fiber domain-containing protein [Blautia wexlerae]MCB6689191.1 tail fiber domain-containing protein [Blautia wexlerae]